MSRRLPLVVTVMGGGQSPLQQLLSKFTPTTSGEVAVRTDIVGANTVYYLSQNLGSGKYWTIELHTAEAFAEGNEWLSTRRMWIDSLYAGHNDQSTPAVTFGGAHGGSTGTYPGGRFIPLQATDAYAQLVAPANTTAVGVVGNATSSSGGLALVTIDGDATLATSLPTAQDVVDSGDFPNTILVANGGTLNPTDRVWDTYNRTNNYRGLPLYNAYAYTLFATGLAADTYTIRITQTGYKQAASSNANIVIYMIISFGSGYENTVASLGTLAVFIDEIDIKGGTTTYARNEISYNTKPTGASGYEWVGHSGSLKFAAGGTPTCTVDAVSKTLSDNTQFTGTEIIITEQLTARHTEIGGGATTIGVLDLTYTLNATTGLTIAHSMAWAMGGVALGYPCMMVVGHATMDRYQGLGSGETAKDLNNDDDSRNLIANQAMYCWDLDGSVATMIYIPDLSATVENWTKSGGFKFDWRDLAVDSGLRKKAYANRFNSDEAFTAATVWTSEANYRAMWFADGAANHLS